MSTFGPNTSAIMGMNPASALYGPNTSAIMGMRPPTSTLGPNTQYIMGVDASRFAASPPVNWANVFGTGGMIMSIFGSANAAIGSYYAAESRKNELKMQAQNARFASGIAALNARAGEFGAQTTMIAGERQLGAMGLQAGQRRASAATSMAARGMQAGVGTAAEIAGSMRLVDEMDRLTVNANRIRAAEAQRMQSMNYQLQAVSGAASAQNLMASAGTISPGMGMFTSLLGSAGSISQSWATNRRIEELLAAQSQMRF